MYKKRGDARAALLLCQLNLLLFDVPDARRRRKVLISLRGRSVFLVRFYRAREEDARRGAGTVPQFNPPISMLPRSCLDDYMVNQCSETTLILRYTSVLV